MENKNELLIKIEDALSEKKLFLNKEFLIRDLSSETGITSHTISYLINSEYKMRFQDYINLKRIQYFIAQKEYNRNIKWDIVKLSILCGFRCRTTFFRAFVKHTGMSPTDYIKNWDLKN